jgi:hypothetical protein
MIQVQKKLMIKRGKDPAIQNKKVKSNKKFQRSLKLFQLIVNN